MQTTNKSAVVERSRNYKQTEVGVIPEDWEVKELGELGSFSKGKGVRKDESNSGDIPCVRYGELYTRHENVIKKYYSYISDEVAKTAYQLKCGDILFAGSGETKAEIGKSVAFLDEFITFAGGDIVVLSPKHVNSLYLGYLLNKSDIQSQKASRGQGDAVVHISASQLAKIQIPLPSLPEQQAIAEVLSDTDAYLAQLEQLIAKKKAIKQGAMEQLLTPPHKGGKRLPGFEGKWMEKELGEIGVCIRGVTYSGDSDLYPFDNSDSIRLLRSNNVFDKNIVIQNLQYVKKDKVKSHQIMKSKDILICMANGSKALVGKAGQFNGASMPYTFGAFMGVFRPKVNDWDGDFIFNVFSTNLFRCHLDIQLSGSSINNLNPSDIENFKFHIPSNQEQKAIAQILSEMDLEIEQLEDKKEKAAQLKQGMMQELLTGKTRLV